jgi:hypothetical protein
MNRAPARPRPSSVSDAGSGTACAANPNVDVTSNRLWIRTRDAVKVAVCRRCQRQDGQGRPVRWVKDVIYTELQVEVAGRRIGSCEQDPAAASEDVAGREQRDVANQFWSVSSDRLPLPLVAVKILQPMPPHSVSNQVPPDVKLPRIT